jgi:hypothetical protein
VSRSVLLFNQFDIYSVKESRKRAVVEEVDAIEPNRLLNTPVDALVKYFRDKYSLDVPVLHEDQVTTDQRETKIDVSHDRMRMIGDRSRPFYIAGSQVDFYVPFGGDPGLFHVQPSRFTFNPPRGQLNNQELVLSFEAEQHDANRLKSTFEGELSQIREYLNWMRAEAEPFNRELEVLAQQGITLRVDRIRRERGVAASTGFPMRRRQGAPETYVAPAVRHKAPVSMPPATGSGKPEPILDIAEYDNILKIITNMVDVMERSPRAFRNMGEEDLRMSFLMQLNGQYEGQATGETFNFDGKTDILIRVEGKNIFVAECAVWYGPERFSEKIDQLLGYATWRGSKLALLVFNRTKNFTAVLEKIKEVVRSHPKFIREVPGHSSERGLRVILRHRDDPERELTLTVLAFEVPA